MDLITKEELWRVAADLPWQDVQLRKPPTDEVVGVMRLRGMTGEEVTAWQEAAVQVKGKQRRQSKHATSLLVVTCAIDVDGAPFFERRDVFKVSQFPGYLLNQLADVALKLSGLAEDDEARQLIEDELIEDFDDAPNGDSIID
jgi:hypothetical protein